MNPLISVVIPSFNSANTIEKCIQSIYQQKINGMEIIVIDDVSTDDSAGMIKSRFPSVKIFE